MATNKNRITRLEKVKSPKRPFFMVEYEDGAVYLEGLKMTAQDAHKKTSALPDDVLLVYIQVVYDDVDSKNDNQTTNR